MKHVIALAAASILLAPAFASAGLTYIGRAVIGGGPNSAIADFSGLPHTLLEDGRTYQDRFDGFGSGMAYTGYENRFFLLNDRGPNKVVYNAAVDNTTSYLNRFQVADITLTGSGNNYSVNVAPVATSMLRDGTAPNATNYIGISTAFTSADASTNRRLDPEGIAMTPDGFVYISDEYGPNIYKFTQTGQKVGSLPLPAKFLISHPAQTVAAEISANTSGRVGNKGMEGIAVTPDGLTLLGAMQSPLLQDAPISGTSSTGTNVRFLKYDLANPSAAPKELVYQLDSGVNLISEVTPVNNHQFIVDERDAVGGASGGIKKLYLIDLDQPTAPTDVSGIAQLSATGNTPGVTALSKTLFADIGSLVRNAPGALVGGVLPDKFEGYAFGPDLADGRHTLLVTNDNDYADPAVTGNYNNYVFAFAVEPGTFSDFQLLQLNPGVTVVPEPGVFAMLAPAALLMGRRRDRKN